MKRHNQFHNSAAGRAVSQKRNSKTIFPVIRSVFLAVWIISLTFSLFSAPFSGRAAGSNAGTATSRDGSQAAGRKLYLPLVTRTNTPKAQIVLGVYPKGYLGNQDVINTQLKAMDSWVKPGAAASIAGTFMSFEHTNPAYDISQQLETLWSNGYTGFINIEANQTAKNIAAGGIDKEIRRWADGYKAWAGRGGGRFAFLAPLAEMNGDWVIWGLDPTSYKSAFTRIQRLFKEQGVPESSVRWVFAPNGWTHPDHPDFMSYYPGDSSVDVVGFSSYNFGYHPYTPTGNWQEPAEVFGPYLAKMIRMAPQKPVFIVQTATSAYAINGINHSKKNQWLRDAYSYLAGFPNVKGILYFNLKNAQNVDWPCYIPGDQNNQFTGYRDGASGTAYRYVSPQELSKMDLRP